eukprot:6043473-Prymnesium_polylepis.1
MAQGEQLTVPTSAAAVSAQKIVHKWARPAGCLEVKTKLTDAQAAAANLKFIGVDGAMFLYMSDSGTASTSGSASIGLNGTASAGSASIGQSSPSPPPLEYATRGHAHDHA